MQVKVRRSHLQSQRQMKAVKTAQIFHPKMRRLPSIICYTVVFFFLWLKTILVTLKAVKPWSDSLALV